MKIVTLPTIWERRHHSTTILTNCQPFSPILTCLYALTDRFCQNSGPSAFPTILFPNQSYYGPSHFPLIHTTQRKVRTCTSPSPNVHFNSLINHRAFLMSTGNLEYHSCDMWTFASKFSDSYAKSCVRLNACCNKLQMVITMWIDKWTCHNECLTTNWRRLMEEMSKSIS